MERIAYVLIASSNCPDDLERLSKNVIKCMRENAHRNPEVREGSSRGVILVMMDMLPSEGISGEKSDHAYSHALAR